MKFMVAPTYLLCIAHRVWAVSTHTQDNPFQQDYNRTKTKPKTLALSLSLSLSLF